MRLSYFEGKRREWDEFLIQNKGSFLQSFNWGEFQKDLGKKIWRFKIISSEKQVLAQAQIIKESFFIPGMRKKEIGAMFYIPYGPCFRNSFLKKEKIIELILKEAKQLAKEEGAIFLKIEPLSSLKRETFLSDLKEVRPLKRIQPKKTLILNLNKSLEEIFQNLHSKTRYNIRLSQKRGVTVREDQWNSADFENFWELIQKTAKRKKIRSYSKDYYRKLLKIMDAELFLAEYKNKVIAANIVIFFGKKAIYLHGGSDYQFRSLMAPHFLQWKQIERAKEKGCVEYDFWGIDEKKWPGLTRFKKGFGGEEITYPEGKDFIFSNFWYRVYRLGRKIFKREV
ncbi:peptidoglycan bridge formation glycyltransferase FemA/FemB family protein [bacterium]|nr:peptidoglycan bridge formation glycyltransferase FemA/FemB family protein [bacterium]